MLIKKNLFKSLLFVFLLSSVFLLNGCSGGAQIPPVVCEYGDVIFEVAEVLIIEFPDIPPEIITYVNLAKMNLQILCETEPGSNEHNEALNSLEIIKDRLSIVVSDFKESLGESKK